jgi:hypothetical protein
MAVSIVFFFIPPPAILARKPTQFTVLAALH